MCGLSKRDASCASPSLLLIVGALVAPAVARQTPTPDAERAVGDGGPMGPMRREGQPPGHPSPTCTTGPRPLSVQNSEEPEMFLFRESFVARGRWRSPVVNRTKLL